MLLIFFLLAQRAGRRGVGPNVNEHSIRDWHQDFQEDFLEMGQVAPEFEPQRDNENPR